MAAFNWVGPIAAPTILNMGPLAVLAPLLDRLDLARIIDRHLPADTQQEFAHGDVLGLLLADTAYGGDDNVQAAAALGVEVISPVAGPTSPIFRTLAHSGQGTREKCQPVGTGASRWARYCAGVGRSSWLRMWRCRLLGWVACTTRPRGVSSTSSPWTSKVRKIVSAVRRFSLGGASGALARTLCR